MLRDFTGRSTRPSLARITAIVLFGLSLPWAPTPGHADSSPAQTSGVEIPPGQIEKAIGRLDELAADMMKRSGVPGMAVAVVQGDKTVYAKGFGVRKAGEAAPVDADTVFQIASLSKPLTGSVVAHQVGAGIVKWDTPVIAHLPWFRLSDPWITDHVTIGDMFSHRSGLPDHAGDDLEDLGHGRRHVLEQLRLLPLHGFRQIYNYTNFGMTAAAEAVAQASGKPWEILAEEVLYEPLDMASTSSRFADFEKQANRAIGHVKVGNDYEPKYQRLPDEQSPAGGVSSSVRDLARWMTMILQNGRFEGREIVPEAALLPALTAQMIAAPSATVDARPGFYGYGMGVGVSPSGRMILSHSGAFALGASTYVAMIPSADIAIVVLTNASPSGAAEALGASFADLVEFGKITRDWFPAYAARLASVTAPVGTLIGKSPPADQKPAAPLASYAGAYGNDYFGNAVIAVVGNELELMIGKAPTKYRLTHWNGDVFAFHPSSENQPDGSVAALTFERNAGGTATAFTIDYLDENGLGQFVRR
ncbi:serine hydrolase [Rhodoligotrophos defluvii]|uniref:serine hydrolase n=1 Tax=Rhodoligotrophos defluvii TaxID=2561934 RepID=UPI0010C9572E|nr:serine hydrolase [Rhodoligotrophos defluvii]